jgi:serpin B
MLPRWAQVDEAGTEAAAATVVGIVATAAPADLPVTVKLDRPFAMAVVHEASRALLFLGEVQAPEEWKRGAGSE